ncbi:MAG: ExbD/TolR family protein [Bdellovibrionales bacterium]
MRRRGLGRYMDSRSSTFKIQITSMVDMFVILLVFLLKSFSTSPVQITPNGDLNLPESSVSTDPVDVVKLVVSKNAIFIEDRKIIDLNNGEIKAEDSDKTDAQFIRKLYEELDIQAKKTRDIASVNETVEFDGKILMQADRDLPYALLQKVLYTSMLAGYADMKLAVVGK